MKTLSVISAVFMMGSIGIALLLTGLGFRINLTDSIPIGLYRITGMKNLKNSFVIFCPDDRPAFKLALEREYISSGLCPNGYGYLMKKIVAKKGDIVSINSQGVFINQINLPFSAAKSKDGKNRVLLQWNTSNYMLKDDEFLTMTSQSEWSYDSRYYGLVSMRQIKGVIKPVWVILK